jgi:RNA polymerase sigma-70 factor (ECF subfamily)
MAFMPRLSRLHPLRYSRPVTQVGAAETQLLDALRAGDEGAFAALVQEYHASLVRVARTYVSTLAAAEEVAQETWVGVLNGLDRFEGRSSLRTWIFRILTNIAKTRAQRDRRTVPFASLEDESGAGEPSVDPERFRPASDRWAGHWKSYPDRWDELPEERLVADETLARVQEAIDGLPPVQRQVITMRDVEGCSSEEVCSALELSETNQRVLLHRARSKVRQALEAYLAQDVR